MTGFALRRLLLAMPLILVILVVTFILIHLAPGDPIYVIAGQSGDAAYYAAMRAKYGLDRPIAEQLLTYLGYVARLDLGTSYSHSQPVLHVMLGRLPATLLLMVTALTLSTILGVFLGLLAARYTGSGWDHAVVALAIIAAAIPGFWLGQVLIIVFAGWFGWFPVQGMTTARTSLTGVSWLLDVGHHLVLPVISLTMLQLAIVTRLSRSAVRQAIGEDFARTALAKGASIRRILFKHALPNALLPLITVVGNQFGTLLTGAVLTEIIFAWPGLGRLLFDAVMSRDYPLLMGIFLMASISVILVNLLTDILYGIVDPRVRLG